VTVTVDKIQGCFDVTQMEILLSAVPYMAKSLIRAFDSTERHKLWVLIS